MEEVSARQGEDPFQVGRRQHFAVQDARAETRRNFVDERQTTVPEGFPSRGPGGLGERIGHVLDEERRHVTPRRCEAVVHGRGQRQLDHRPFGQPAPTRGFEAGVEFVQAARTHVDRAPVLGSGRRAVARRADKPRQGIQRQVDLETPAPKVQGVDVPRNFGREGLPTHQAEQRARRVRVRHDDGGFHDAAVFEFDPGGPAVAEQHAAHGRRDLERGPGLPGGIGQRVGEGAHAATHVGPDPPRPAGLAHDVVQQDIAGPRRRRGSPGTDHRIRGQGSPQRLALEPAFEGAPGRAEQQLGRAGQVSPEPQQGPPSPGQASQVTRAQAEGVRRGRVEERLEGPRQAIQERLVVGKALGIPGRKLGDRARVRFRVCTEQQPPPVGQRRMRRRIPGQQGKPVPTQVQFPLDRGTQQPHHVGRTGNPKPGPQLLGHARTPKLIAALEDPHVEPPAREERRGDQSVVAAADDRDLASHGMGL